MNPIFYIDFYKVGHVSQYHSDVTQVFSNWTPRTSRVPGTTHITHFGLNYFLKKYLIEEFDQNFFRQPIEQVLADYREVIYATLGVSDPKTDHIRALHRLGYIPLTFYSLPEGAQVPLNVPPIVVKNTLPGEFYWLPNYFETLMSNILWKPSTSATTARRFREVFLKHARAAGETDFSFIDWQGHDFSFRGMSGVEDACLSGMGHLVQFSGTDTIPAILAANKYYRAGLRCGGSVPATEHSVMCAGMEEGEFETFERLITETYPSGIVSIVSDTWDLWRVLTDYIPRLKSVIMAREGKIVIRPDSGDPVKIMCGDPAATGNAQIGVLQLLADALGTTNGMINKAGAIYGDSISVERADDILTQARHKWCLHPYNAVFGIGSYTYQFVTRDTYGWAMKATAYKNRAGEIVPIFKKPVTDDGGKFSHKGIPAVHEFEKLSGSTGYRVHENSTEEQLDNCAFQKVFEDGNLLVDPSFDEIRKRARTGL